MKIALAGTGNVATALGQAFYKAGHEITWVFGRNPDRTKTLAAKLHAVAWTGSGKKPMPPPDVLVIAVKDDALSAVSARFKRINCMVVHTSGSMANRILAADHKRYGVFYPLQTFSGVSRVNLKTTPICIESGSEEGLKMLLQLAYSISRSVYLINSEQRQELHLAAVFANNFSNLMFTLAEEILTENHLSFDLLKPILLTAAKNMQHLSPSLSQTGPAVRHDKISIQKHLSMMKNQPERAKIYRLLTNCILKKYPVRKA